MNYAALKVIAFRGMAFASTLAMSLAILSNLPKFKERRQRYFAEAAMNGSLYRMQWLRLAGVNINARGNGYSPLRLAAGEGRLQSVRYLLDQGADVNASENYGNTALTEATYYGHIPIMRELLIHGANVNAISKDGTALDIATSRNNATAVDLLMHHGAKRAADLR